MYFQAFKEQKLETRDFLHASVQCQIFVLLTTSKWHNGIKTQNLSSEFLCWANEHFTPSYVKSPQLIICVMLDQPVCSLLQRPNAVWPALRWSPLGCSEVLLLHLNKLMQLSKANCLWLKPGRCSDNLSADRTNAEPWKKNCRRALDSC